MSLVLTIQRTQIDPVATYSDCSLSNNGVITFRKEGIENSKLHIAVGAYAAHWTKSPRFTALATEKARKIDPMAKEVEIWTWEIFGVMDGTRLRAGIRIHPVNFARDMLGCVGFGMELGDLDNDNVQDLLRSREAHKQFNTATLGYDQMMVIVKDPA